MKFSFYLKGSKKKVVTLKAKTPQEIIQIQKLAKIKVLENQILRDFDFKQDNVMVCVVNDKTYTMKELVIFIENLNKKNNKSDKKKSDKKNKTKDSKKKKSKKSKKKSKKDKDIKTSKTPKTENGLIRISRR